jgi:hypothetical protein
MDDTERDDPAVPFARGDHAAEPARSTRPDEARPPDRTRSTAWVSLAMVAVAVVLGRWISTSLLEWRDDGSVFEPDSAAVGLIAYLLFAAIVVPPVVLAVHNGQCSRRRGHRDGVVVAGLAAGVGIVVLLGLPVFLSHIVGWPLVVAVTLGVVGVGWLTQRYGWGNVGGSGPIRSG